MLHHKSIRLCMIMYYKQSLSLSGGVEQCRLERNPTSKDYSVMYDYGLQTVSLSSNRSCRAVSPRVQSYIISLYNHYVWLCNKNTLSLYVEESCRAMSPWNERSLLQNIVGLFCKRDLQFNRSMSPEIQSYIKSLYGNVWLCYTKQFLPLSVDSEESSTGSIFSPKVRFI